MGTPFPWLQVCALAIVVISHSYSLTSLFPYVGYMVQQLGVTDNIDEAGYYAGYLSSGFMIGRFTSSYFWGRFADHYGRLPVLYIGLTSIAVLSLAFGLSTRFWWALTCRFLLGVLNGLMAMSKCMISEICGKQHEQVGMGYVNGCWSFGLVIGPAFGGLLVQPATHYPTVFSQTGLFGRYPYLLPNIVGASIALTGLPMVFFFLRETCHLENDTTPDSRAGFKLLPTSEEDVCPGTPEMGMEEGRRRVLEMTPLTQSSSFDDDRDDGNEGNVDESLALLLGKRLNDSSSAGGPASHVGGGGGGGVGGHKGISPAPAVALVSNKSSWTREGSRSGAINLVANNGATRPGIGSETPIDSDGGRGNGGRDNRDRYDPGSRTKSDRFLEPSLEPSRGELHGTSPPSPAGRDETLDFAASGGENEGHNNDHDVRRGADRDTGTGGANGYLKNGASFGNDDDADASSDRANKKARSVVCRECLVPVKLLAEKRVRAVLFVYGVYSFAIVGFEEIYPLWALSTVPSGGLDWTTKEIGQVLSLVGVGLLGFQFCVYPWLSKRMGVTMSQRWACFLTIPSYAFFPLLSRLRDSRAPLFVGSILLIFLSNASANTLSVNVSLATNNAVDPSRRGTLNGLSMMLGSLSKAAGPAFFSAIFAWSINNGRHPFPLDFHLAFSLLALNMVAVCWASWDVITDDPPPSRESKAYAAVAAETEGGADDARSG